MAVAVQMAAALQPDIIVHLGDFLDFAPFSRFAQETGFRDSTQAGIDAGYRFLAELRAAAPHHKGWMLEGNHDKRISDTLAKLAPELARLRRADDKGWPVMSLPGLLRLDEVGVEFVAGYPANEVYLSPKVRCIHGNRVASTSSTASLLSKDARANTLFGHVHRMELHHRTVGTFAGPSTVWACSPGTLARTDGAVPSFHSGTSVETAASLRVAEDWQQGVAVVSWVGDDDPVLELVRIQAGCATYRGVSYSAPVKDAEAA
jgi:predicted phosphodiesterase